MSEPKVQVVLLLDRESLSTSYRAQCLACVRLLLLDFPNIEHPTQWSWKLFSSRTPAKLMKRGTSEFQNLHSEVMAKFFYELDLNSQVTNSPQPPRDVWGRHVYSALAAAVQDFVWDAPEIKTPVHPRPRQRKSRRNQKTNARAPPSSPHANRIFLFSEGPGDCDGGPLDGTSVCYICTLPLRIISMSSSDALGVLQVVYLIFFQKGQVSLTGEALK